MKNANIKIIGGGIGGLCTALGLQKNGFDYMLYEQNSSIGYDRVGLGISRNILPLLDRWNVLEETLAKSTEIRNFAFVDRQLNVIKAFKLTTPALCIDRSIFHKLLLKRIPAGNIELNAPVMNIGELQDSNDLIIAADGIYSKVRQFLYPEIKLRYSGQTLWRGIAQINLPDKFQQSYYDFIGDNIRFAIIATGQNLYSWYLIKQEPENGKDNPGTIHQDLQLLLKGFAPVVHDVIRSTENIYRSDLVDIRPSDRKNIKWYYDNMVLIGDAIHPTTPNMANGACQAMEDAFVLTELLRRHHPSWATTFERYQRIRENNVNKIVRQSWLLGKAMHQENKILQTGIKIGMKLTPERMFNSIYSQVLKNNYSHLFSEVGNG